MGRPRKRILFVFTSVPYPLRSHGVSVRYLPIIQYLSRSHDIDLIITEPNTDRLCQVDGLREYCRNIDILPDPRIAPHDLVSKGLTYANFLLPWTSPLSAVAHDSSEVTRKIVATGNSGSYNVLIWVGAYLLPNLISALPRMSVGKVVVDFIDSPYLWVNRAKEKAFSFGPLDRYERWKTCRWEGKIIRNVNATIYISKKDAEAVPPELGPMEKRHIIPNGINIPVSSKAEPVVLPSPNIGFLGNMRYPPNIEAVEWLYQNVFAPLKGFHPNLSLVVIGKNPAPSIKILGNKPGVIITGTVEDIWPYILGVDIFVFPLLRGAGLKNKILEAMYARRPVITTEIGNEGIDAISGRDLVISRTAEDFQRETTRLLASHEMRHRMGNSATAFVNENFSWDQILQSYENLLFGQGSSGGQEITNTRRQ